MSVLYHPGKANVVANTLSRLSMGSVAHVEDDKKDLVRDVHRLTRLDVKAKQGLDPIFVELKEAVLKNSIEVFFQGVDGVLRYQDRMLKLDHLIPVKGSYSLEDYAKLYLREMVRLHGVPLSIICDCGTQFTSQFWKSFKKDLGTRVKLSTGNLVDHLPLIEFAYNNSYHSSIGMTPFEAHYGRRCRSHIRWFEVGKIALIGYESVHDTMEKVQLTSERLKIAQSRQKSYVDVIRRDIEFDVDDWVNLKISLIKDVMRFGKKEKFSPCYVGQYHILRRIGKVVYELDLPNDLALVHSVFHVSFLKKCVGDPTSVVPFESLDIKEILSYEEVLVDIFDRQVKKLRNKEVASVKVLWRKQRVEGDT
ncbi:hypothetical protein MTR67_017556 [Solanum verrucosum]|uniref:Tf2-1-like SH3-like domain-containing protein n=1 Tax=Solanum verrucosum TaxID=315347 RepID=A0AAF0TLL6_SOLVR|nr:hypothetical protein MTR67_017556 [Solanum verrucosum]